GQQGRVEHHKYRDRRVVLDAASARLTDHDPSCTDRDPLWTDRVPSWTNQDPCWTDQLYSGRVSFYTRALRPALFALHAERAHELTIAALHQPFVARALGWNRDASTGPGLSQQVFGLRFSNPLGLAAGLDKQGDAVTAWSSIGFGFAEIGTVTPLPQPGNPRPRLFRLQRDRAIINRFGFNSEGAEGVARNLSQTVRVQTDTAMGLRVGINIGKNKDTPNEQAVEDYVRAIDVLHPFADYFAINVSSPNTEGLRDLQEGRWLRLLVERTSARVAEQSPARAIPVLVKISPDSANHELLRSVDAASEGGAAGVIATNTTVSRPSIQGRFATEAGGLSGAPLKNTANAVCKVLYQHLRG